MKEWARQLRNQIRFSDKSMPFVFLAVMLVSFGIYYPFTGFYWDDWPVVYIAHTHNSPWQYLLPDRPFMAWPAEFIFPILNASPFLSKAVYFLIRWLIVIFLWWCLRLVWPHAKRQIFCTALLFSIYPVFFQNFSTLTLETHFIAYLLYLVSVVLMLLAIRKTKWSFLLFLLSVTITVVELMTVEYFWGLELLRPVFLWIVLSEQVISRRNRLIQTFLKWLPYLIAFALIIAWRFFFLDYQNENTPTTLSGLFSSPLSTSVELVQTIVQDGLYILVNTWTRTVNPQSINFKSTLSIISWGGAILLSHFISIYLSLTGSKNSTNTEESPRWSMQAIYVGIFAVLVGLIPTWMTGRQVSVGLYSDRFAIPAIIGLSLVIVGIIFQLASQWKYQLLLVAILIGLSGGLHLRVGNDYRRDWNSQQAFYWQLYWRAPALENNTSLLSEGGMFSYVTKYSLASAINTLYPVPDGTTQVPYWAFELDDLNSSGFTPDALINGVKLQYSLRTLNFIGSSENSIVISYNRNEPHCLWVLTPLDADYPYLGQFSSQTLNVTNLDQIIPEPKNPNYPDVKIFGDEPEHTWCYFFEKADLARQFANWDAITDLGDLAIESGYSPNKTYEWIPFIEGYIHERNWERAVYLTYETAATDSYYKPALCAAWIRSLDGMSLSEEENELVMETFASLDCSK